MNTKLERWVNLFINSKMIYSQVHDVQHRPLIEEDIKEEYKMEGISSADHSYLVKSQRSEIGQAVADNTGKLCIHLL